MTNMGSGFPWRIVGWGFAMLVLLLPLVAMQFTREVNWTVGDFIFAGFMIGCTGLAFELAIRASNNVAYRAAVAIALATAVLTIWVNGAVGMIGDEGNPYNLLFLGVVGLALAGAGAALFRSGGMALAMTVAASAQLVIALGGLSADVRGGLLSAMFAGPWLLSGALFRRAARDEGRAGPPSSV